MEVVLEYLKLPLCPQVVIGYLLLLGVSMPGCTINHPPYPMEWGSLPQLTPTVCPDVSGKYLYARSSIQGGDLGAWHLGTLLQTDENPNTLTGSVAQIYNSGNSLNISYNTEKSIKSSYLLLGDDACTDGMVSLPQKIRFISPGIGFVRATTSIVRNVDGNLVVRDCQRGAGLFYLVIPSIVDTCTWYLFKEAQRGQPLTRDNK